MTNMALQEINSSDITEVQLLRTGKFSHGVFGNFEITREILSEMKENFDKNVRRVKLAVDYFHESFKEAAGWIESLELREDGEELWINVEWTEEAAKKLSDKEIRYISADLDFSYVDSETQEQHGATLLGAGLTNRPHIKGMKAILSEAIEEQETEVILNQKDSDMINFEDILEAITGLDKDQQAQIIEKMGVSEETAEIVQASEESLKLAEAKLTDKDAEIVKLSEEVSSIKSELEAKKKENEFVLMLSEGKAVEAQREAFIKGDITEFAKNAVQVNLDEAGSGQSGEEEITPEQAEAKLNKLIEARVKDEGMEYAEATKVVASENPELHSKAVA